MIVFWGCKPKPKIILSGQIGTSQNSIEVDHLPVAVEGVEQDVSPRCGRELCDERSRFAIAVRFIPGEQPRQDGRVIVNDRIGD